MFLRRHERSKDGKDHIYWSLVETVRTPDGPRQRRLCSLGELNSSAQARWLKTIEVFNEQGESHQLKLFPSDVEPPEEDAGVARVRLDQVRLDRSRRFGDRFLGLELWKRLELDRFWEALLDGPEDVADVAWSRIAALLAINRLCAPGSELAIEERWYPSTALEKRVAEGQLKDRNKIERKLGAIQARHPQVADLYEMQVVEASGVLSLQWQALPGRQTWQRVREGAYLLRTNLPPDQPENLWKSYIQLTEAEAAFRALKSELSIRPIFHQLERRAKAHILVAFLGYALWVTLKHLLIRKGSAFSPAQALSLMGTLMSADIVLPTTEGREIRLRRVTTPRAEQKQLLDLLGIAIPDRLSFDQECSADSAIA